MPQNLVVASFFQERVETVKLASGGTAFIQRPKAKTEGSVQSAGDLPDDFDIGHIVANAAQIYRISIGPIDVSLRYSSKVLLPYYITLIQISGNTHTDNRQL